ncbi:hypothetical protein BGZ72_000939 [Mortierella alpina]|nr:hypothetical protein BGZ72_000939 [Mortierella alpina]
MQLRHVLHALVAMSFVAATPISTAPTCFVGYDQLISDLRASPLPNAKVILNALPKDTQGILDALSKEVKNITQEAMNIVVVLPENIKNINGCSEGTSDIFATLPKETQDRIAALPMETQDTIRKQILAAVPRDPKDIVDALPSEAKDILSKLIGSAVHNDVKETSLARRCEGGNCPEGNEERGHGGQWGGAEIGQIIGNTVEKTLCLVLEPVMLVLKWVLIPILGTLWSTAYLLAWPL